MEEEEGEWRGEGREEDSTGSKCYYEILRFPTILASSKPFSYFEVIVWEVPQFVQLIFFDILLGWVWTYLCFWLNVKNEDRSSLKMQFLLLYLFSSKNQETVSCLTF